jgi:hypothetical protein
MRSFEFCEHFPSFGGRSGASSDPRWARSLIENFAQEGGVKGGHPHNNHRGLPNNSYFEDFYRAKKMIILSGRNLAKKPLWSEEGENWALLRSS